MWLCRSLILLAMLLTGCGFQLAGSVEIDEDLKQMYVRTDDTFTLFYQELTDALERNGVTLSDGRGSGIAVLDIRQDVTGQRVLSVSARNVPREFEVFYTVSYTVQIDGAIRSGADNLTLARDYTWFETQLLGKADEETVIREALVKELVATVLRRLAYSESR